MKSCDLSSGAAKLELALKSLRTTINAVDQQWNDGARRKFQENHLMAIEPNVRTMFDAIGRLAEVIASLKGSEVSVLIAQSDLNHSRRLVDSECVIERGANVEAEAA